MPDLNLPQVQPSYNSPVVVAGLEEAPHAL
jgi:hypothetical protein